MPARKTDGASIDAIERHIADLTDADLLRLERFARSQVFRYSAVSPKEVLGEAVARVLAGSRNWPPGVPFDVFFRNVIRSVADDFRQHAREHAPVPGDANVAADGQGSTEEQAADRAFLASIWKLFDGDDAVRALLAGIESGLTGKEIHRKYSLSEDEYGAARKRLARTLAKHFPDGMKS